MAEPAPTTFRQRARRAASILLQLAIAVAVVALTIRFLGGIDWAALKDRIGDARPGWLAVGVGCLLGRLVVWDVRWRLAFGRVEAAPGPLETFLGLMAGIFVNHVTPSARILGGIVRARAVSRGQGSRFGRAYGVVLFDQLVHQVVMGIFALLALAGLAFLTERPALALVVLGLLGAGIGGLVWWIGREGSGRVSRLADRFGSRLEARGGRLEELMGHGREAVGVVRDLVRDAPVRRRAMALTLGFLLLSGGAQWSLFAALGVRPSFLVPLIGVVTGAVAGALAGTPGGLGATEAGMVVTFVTLGVEEVDALAGTLLFRAGHYLLVILVGLPAFVGLEMRNRRRRRRRGGSG